MQCSHLSLMGRFPERHVYKPGGRGQQPARESKSSTQGKKWNHLIMKFVADYVLLSHNRTLAR